MNKELIAVPGQVVIIKIKDADHGFFARINDVTRDMLAKNRVCWLVDFTPLLPFEKLNIVNIQWKLNDEHIYGEEFTMDGVFHQLCKVDFPKSYDEKETVAITKHQQASKKKAVVSHLRLVKKE